ncbi:hypothetical protein CMEL01_14021 [Colletotrichum melonis]|uniref:O-methyltransferase C-terminal domain-containing protein n=1 Tax=Colletotrichum melonis TaxID=1209925 RepID=A0AAI9XSF7_9PEZI|nr:hypothetical protein CMEL01_14021 [Colletotrichum melonis]
MSSTDPYNTDTTPNSTASAGSQQTILTRCNFHSRWVHTVKADQAGWMKAFTPRNTDGFYDSQDSVLLVDVGGSFGHDIDEFCRKHPEAPGRPVVQDLSTVINQIEKLDEKIERMGHDFFTEQPIKGARAYYMHSVLHDWPDKKCEEILARATAAMKPGYSRLLVNENCIPDTGADWQNTGQDIMMLTLVSSKERTRVEWQSLLEKAGLRILGIYGGGNGVESLIECELA